jgi:antitoxin (DNA-binding transcriptional repressor) of toxin-antitoxin stability system
VAARRGKPVAEIVANRDGRKSAKMEQDVKGE